MPNVSRKALVMLGASGVVAALLISFGVFFAS
jgi:hypothetical protein